MESNPTEVFYTISDFGKQGRSVVIYEFSQERSILNEESLKIAIKNIKRNREVYKSQEAYEHEVNMYQGALDYLQKFNREHPQ